MQPTTRVLEYYKNAPACFYVISILAAWLLIQTDRELNLWISHFLQKNTSHFKNLKKQFKICMQNRDVISHMIIITLLIIKYKPCQSTTIKLKNKYSSGMVKILRKTSYMRIKMRLNTLQMTNFALMWSLFGRKKNILLNSCECHNNNKTI